jgi:hypothetical protein
MPGKNPCGLRTGADTQAEQDFRERLASIKRCIPLMHDVGGIWPRDVEWLIAELDRSRASLLERHRDGEWESANAADLTGARWYCEHCDAWGTVEIVRLPQLDAENLVCLKCRYQVAAFIPASAGPSPEKASK